MKGTFRQGKTVFPLLLAILVGSGLVAAPALIASSRPSTTPASTNTTTTTSKGTQPGSTGMVAGPASTTTQSKQSNQPSQLPLGSITPVLMILVALILSLGVNRLAQSRVGKAR